MDRQQANREGVPGRPSVYRPRKLRQIEITPVHSHIGGMTLMGSLGNCAFSVQEVLEACLVGGYFELRVGNTKFALDGLCQAPDTVDSGRRVAG